MALIDQIIGAESGGDPTAKNPRSSATGAAQFVERTWLDMLSRHRPDLKGSREELLELRKDPALSREMAERYAADNGAVLSGAGLPVNLGTQYLAHFAGPQGAIGVLKADPSTPIEGILDPRAIAANPFLKGMTAGDLTAWAGKKMGGSPQQLAQQPAPVSPAAPINAIPQQAAPMLPQPAQQQAAQQPVQAPEFAQLPAGQMMQPPLTLGPPQRRPIDLRALRAALNQPPQRGFFSGKA